MIRTSLATLVRELRSRLGAENVLSAPSDLAVYECDGFTIEKNPPDAVVFPRSTKQVAEVVRLCGQHGVPLLARGAGTSLAGGCLPIDGGVVLMLTRMKRIVEIDLRHRMAVVEAGVPNIQLTRALAGSGYHFAPDPSSQGACTIGGNVATNAGGPHTLKYGVTVNHVLGVEAVLGDGSVAQFGPVDDPAGFDLAGVLVGSEGTLAVITRIWVRLTPDPQDFRALRVIFNTVDDATNAISDVIGAGLIPAAMELMDQGIVGAVEEAYHFGFPLDAGAIVVIELDGPTPGLDAQQRQIAEICQKWHAREILQAATPQERELLWKCRKMAVGAVGRLSPSYCIQDGVVPRTGCRISSAVWRKSAPSIPCGLSTWPTPATATCIRSCCSTNATAASRPRLGGGRELLEECIQCGGSVTAEHGIGVEKIAFMDRLFTAHDLTAMARLRRAFCPDGRLGRGKVLPAARGQGPDSAVPCCSRSGQDASGVTPQHDDSTTLPG